MIRRSAALAALVLLIAGCARSQNGAPSADETFPPVATPDESAKPGRPLVALEEWSDVTAVSNVVAPEGSDAWFIVDRGGKILRFDGEEEAEILDISSEVSTEAEEGLFDLAVSPDGDYAYIHFTGREKPYGDNHIREYRWTGEGVDGEGREVLVVPHPYPHHNGGQIAFGPDDHLYIAIGDGGTKTLKQEPDNGDPHNHGQETDELLGNVLRIDPRPSGDREYGIPDDNPFVGRDGRDEIWAYGLRNPWRFSFDRETGDMWLPDVGHRFWEEINFEPAGSKGGRNYGWSWMEGPIDYKGDPPSGHTLPLYAYPHRGGPCAIIGGYVYRGSQIDALEGNYVFGDFCTGELQMLELDGGKVTSRKSLAVNVPQLVAIAEDRDGELFAVSYGKGIFRISPRD
jgi:glucose/arabinose dehydrogenase